MMFYVYQHIVPAAYALLPKAMDTPQATALLMAIGGQESKFAARRQVGGPARSFFQFEQGGGVTGVLTHPATKAHVEAAMTVLCYPRARWTAPDCFAAIEHNDVLAVVFARLLLYALPDALPERTDTEGGWAQYLAAWRPGKPHHETWTTNYTAAWTLVAG